MLRRDVTRGRPARPMRLFHTSIAFLALLLLCIPVDVLLGDRAGTVVGTWRESGVEVQVRWLPDVLVGDGAGAGAGDGTVEATFTPLSPGFHLYGTELAEAGAGGVGRPTRLLVGGSLRSTAAVRAEPAAAGAELAGVDVPVPLYPAGPVTLRVTAHRTATGPDEAAGRATITYAACDAATCLPPVVGRELVLSLPPVS